MDKNFELLLLLKIVKERRLKEKKDQQSELSIEKRQLQDELLRVNKDSAAVDKLIAESEMVGQVDSEAKLTDSKYRIESIQASLESKLEENKELERQEKALREEIEEQNRVVNEEKQLKYQKLLKIECV